MSPLENYLLQAYLDGALDESEESAFELLLLERPDLAELVEADCALRMGLGGQPKQSAGSASPGVLTVWHGGRALRHSRLLIGGCSGPEA